MNWLLLPEDELQLAMYLTGAEGLRLVSPVLEGDTGIERIDLTVRMPHELPAFGTANLPTEFVFWSPSLGPIRLLGDRPDDYDGDARTRVALRITMQASPEWRDLLDLQRTPVIRLRRSMWYGENTLTPALLQGMDLKTREHPPEVLRLMRSVSRWLKREGGRLNPFEHCRAVPVPMPQNLAPFWVWARPAALEWVRAGGEIWPWTA